MGTNDAASYFLVEAWSRCKRAGATPQKRITIWRRSRNVGAAHGSRSAGTVVNYYGLAERFRHQFGVHPRACVGRPPRGKGYNDGDGPVWIVRLPYSHNGQENPGDGTKDGAAASISHFVNHWMILSCVPGYLRSTSHRENTASPGPPVV